eukprot:2174073-Pyramimonas_sp.AAC.1
MFASWHEVVRSLKCVVHVRDCYWMTTAADDSAGVVLESFRIPRISRNEGFRCLGAWITMDHNATRCMQRMLSRGWAAFTRRRAVLCAKQGKLGRRLQLQPVVR